MATPGVYLVMSEPLFDKHPNSDRQVADAVLGGVIDLAGGGIDRLKGANKISKGEYGTGVDAIPGAIEVLEFNFDIKQIGSEEGGRPRSIEDIQRSEFRFKKPLDCRSPKLFKYCCEGAFIGAAELQIFGPTSKPYLTYRMTYVHVSSYEPSGGEDLATEWIGLKYGQMAVKWDESGIGEAKHGNAKTGVVINRFSWVMQAPIEFPSGIPGLMEGSAFKLK